MKDVLSPAFRRDMLGQRQDDAGKWLCSCGAALDDEEVSCSACRAATERKRIADERDRRHAAWRSSIEQCAALAGVPEWPGARGQVNGQLLLTASDLYELGDGSMLLLGPSGCGKTSAVVALLQRLAATEVPRVLALGFGTRPSPLLLQLRGLAWITGQQLAKARRQARIGTGEAPTVERALEAPLLVLDEVGFESAHDDVLFEVVDQRYAAQLPTLITSGRTKVAFQRRYGDALWRRLTERGTVVSEWSEADEERDAGEAEKERKRA